MSSKLWDLPELVLYIGKILVETGSESDFYSLYSTSKRLRSLLFPLRYCHLHLNTKRILFDAGLESIDTCELVKSADVYDINIKYLPNESLPMDVLYRMRNITRIKLGLLPDYHFLPFVTLLWKMPNVTQLEISIFEQDLIPKIPDQIRSLKIFLQNCGIARLSPYSFQIQAAGVRKLSLSSTHLSSYLTCYCLSELSNLETLQLHNVFLIGPSNAFKGNNISLAYDSRLYPVFRINVSFHRNHSGSLQLD